MLDRVAILSALTWATMVVLAVSYTLLDAWVQGDKQAV